MEVIGEVPLGHIGGDGIGHGDAAIQQFALPGRGFGEGTYRLRISNELDELLAHVRCPPNPIGLGYQLRCSHKKVEQWRLVRHGSEAMELDKSECQRSGKVPLAVKKDTLPGHKDIIEDCQGFEQVMPGTDGVVEGIVIGMAERADDQFKPFGIHWYSKRHSVFLVLRTEGARGNHHQLVSTHGVRRVRLSTAHDNAILGLVYDAYVVVGMLLLMGV